MKKMVFFIICFVLCLVGCPIEPYIPPVEPNVPPIIEPNEPPVVEPNEPPVVEPNVPLPPTSDLGTMGGLLSYWRQETITREDNNMRWWISRYEKDWEVGNKPPWYLVDRLEVIYGLEFWKN